VRPLELLVVIPCLNEIDHIEVLLLQLLMENPALIVVVDGGSTDGTIETVKTLASNDSRVKYLHNPKKIQSAGINLAVREYGEGFKYFVRVDAHGDYPKCFLAHLLSDACAQQADSVVISMKTMGKSCFQVAAAAAQNSKLGNGGSLHRNESADGCWIDHGHHALMKVSAFNLVNGYDETFVANEDAELDYRLGLVGKKIWLTSKTCMTYYPRKTIKSLFVQYYRYGLGRASNILKHKTKPKVRQIIPVLVFPGILLSLLAPLYWVFVLPVVAWFTVCIGYGFALGVKASRSCVFLSGLVAVIMHMGWSFGFCQRLAERLAKRGRE
jgi:succinoglycan biosynthesis protein ExoA